MRLSGKGGTDGSEGGGGTTTGWPRTFLEPASTRVSLGEGTDGSK